jgi:hypothetical protein
MSAPALLLNNERSKNSDTIPNDLRDTDSASRESQGQKVWEIDRGNQPL